MSYTNTLPTLSGVITIGSYTTKTTTYNAVAGDKLICDTSGGSFAVTLPTGVAGSAVDIWDYDGTWGTNNLTITPQTGEKINGATGNLVCNISNSRVTLVYCDTTRGWQMDIGGNFVGSGGGGYAVIQALGTKDTNYTVDFNSGRFATVTVGTGTATVTISDWAQSTQSVNAWLYITQHATTPRVQTLSGNIKSSGALLNGALPNSGAGTTDAFEVTWDGTHWFVSNAIFDVKHA